MKKAIVMLFLITALTQFHFAAYANETDCSDPDNAELSECKKQKRSKFSGDEEEQLPTIPAKQQ